jgi:ArsR family transcriptional regulator, arsenate/arsenite/antimonite-responsive transcriptional repressor
LPLAQTHIVQVQNTNLTIPEFSYYRTDMKTSAAVSAFGALAHGHRLAIFRLLVERGPDGLSAGMIAERLELLPSSLTFHLQNLHRAGLITQQRVSRQLIYRADFDAMNELIGYLTENCCGEGGSVCATACESVGRSKAKSRRAA